MPLATLRVADFAAASTAPCRRLLPQRKSSSRDCGSSAGFLDPVVAIGVALGMVGAAHVADTLGAALATNDEGRPDLMDAHAVHMMHAYNTFATLVNSWYHTTLLHTLFFSPEPNLEWKRGLTSILAGDVFREDNAFQQMLMSSRRKKELVPDLVAPPAAE